MENLTAGRTLQSPVPDAPQSIQCAASRSVAGEMDGNGLSSVWPCGQFLARRRPSAPSPPEGWEGVPGGWGRAIGHACSAIPPDPPPRTLPPAETDRVFAGGFGQLNQVIELRYRRFSIGGRAKQGAAVTHPDRLPAGPNPYPPAGEGDRCGASSSPMTMGLCHAPRARRAGGRSPARPVPRPLGGGGPETDQSGVPSHSLSLNDPLRPCARSGPRHFAPSRHADRLRDQWGTSNKYRPHPATSSPRTWCCPSSTRGQQTRRGNVTYFRHRSPPPIRAPCWHSVRSQLSQAFTTAKTPPSKPPHCRLGAGKFGPDLIVACSPRACRARVYQHQFSPDVRPDGVKGYRPLAPWQASPGNCCASSRAMTPPAIRITGSPTSSPPIPRAAPNCRPQSPRFARHRIAVTEPCGCTMTNEPVHDAAARGILSEVAAS